MKYGALSQEPPQQPVSSRSITPTVGGLGLTGLQTGPMGMMPQPGTPTPSIAGSSQEGVPTTTVSTPIPSSQPAAKNLPKVKVPLNLVLYSYVLDMRYMKCIVIVELCIS